ncbi:acetyl-CoA acetyltransferase [Thiohalobacter thiocyanaticus]|uniref:Acetyl-CoA acetyltransferase n=1 Tax=Thiohalobacter thiocyanaticus TaxID=585455 RepID=A0A1Z4VPC6_9GAMM|nr:hypothetical protein [Thiohalobacter thiocyanaticus]BAZ93198.1 acetyl-CoA acetyltransferase [Thiohalobacter thiocyanaticus]
MQAAAEDRDGPIILSSGGPSRAHVVMEELCHGYPELSWLNLSGILTRMNNNVGKIYNTGAIVDKNINNKSVRYQSAPSIVVEKIGI